MNVVNALRGATMHDLEILARTIYGEARNQPQAGKEAVAWVVRNRVCDKRWPATIHQVCRQRLQFSCWNRNDPNAAILKAAELGKNPELLHCTAAALLVIAGDGGDPTGGANHYYNPKIVKPSWHRDNAVTAIIGDHLFLRL